jgi:hypothetical protein
LYPLKNLPDLFSTYLNSSNIVPSCASLFGLNNFLKIENFSWTEHPFRELSHICVEHAAGLLVAGDVAGVHAERNAVGQPWQPQDPVVLRLLVLLGGPACQQLQREEAGGFDGESASRADFNWLTHV